MGKLDINITQTQQIVMGFISPIIDEIVDRVSERVLAASKKEPKFYTRKEAAEILHVTLPTLARITKDGLLISKRVGSRILYEADAIDEAVKNRSYSNIGGHDYERKEKKQPPQLPIPLMTGAKIIIPHESSNRYDLFSYLAGR